MSGQVEDVRVASTGWYRVGLGLRSSNTPCCRGCEGRADEVTSAGPGFGEDGLDALRVEKVLGRPAKATSVRFGCAGGFVHVKVLQEDGLLF
jgi:hypothetical protein